MKFTKFDKLMAHSLRSLVGVLYGGVQGFQVRKNIIITTQIFVIFCRS